MAALKKGVAFSVGLVTASCSLHGAVEKKASNVTVCCGTEPGKEHDPVRLSQVRRCATCGDVPYTAIKKAREVGDGLVLLEEEELAEAKGDADKYKNAVALTPHPVTEVYSLTAPGEKVYYVTPDPGHEVSYAILRHMIAEAPELAFVGLWTPRSNAAQFRVTTRGDTLVMTELVRSQSLKALPQVTAEAPEPMLAMAGQVLQMPGIISEYNPDTYADRYEENIQALIASKAVVASGGTPAAPTTPSLPAGQQAAMDALAAMLAQAGGTATPSKSKKKVKSA